ncbi:hypothetical protein DL95DRAFT_408121 [Leptodontidium sp. 2 PMI_412]|nr:hypothetical protein DL95DRAFT_408121 [Leptodontidium sp. 2 PMI_412]
MYYNGTAVDKRMEIPKRKMGAFFKREMPRWAPIVPHESANNSTGTAHLKGCTTIYIISRKGVYATHWWENVSFAPDKRWLTAKLKTDAQLFQSTVIDVLKDGGRFHPKLDAGLIEDSYIRAYLVIPTQTYLESGPEDVKCPEQWQQIRDVVGKIIPTLADASLWKDIRYTAVADNEVKLFDSKKRQGKNFFKYDPAHTVGRGSNAKNNSCGCSMG